MIVLLGAVLLNLQPVVVFGQDINAVITPDEAELQPGEGLQFEAFAFTSATANNQTTLIDADQVEWSISALASIEADSVGSITEDGFFMAGRQSAEVVVRAVIHVRGIRILRETFVRIGRPVNRLYDVKVLPERAVVATGQEQQFRVVVTSHDDQVRPGFVRWEVQPTDLGKVDEEGLFHAGSEEGRGLVIAYLEIDGIRLRGAARVIVSPAATGAISGNVMSDNGVGIPDAVVRVVRLGNIPWTSRASTDDNGNYLVDGLLPGVYVVHANARKFIGEFYNDTRVYREATPVQVAEDSTSENIDFKLSEGGKITGVVFADADGLPIAGAHVWTALVVNTTQVRHALTAEDGSYEIGSLQTGHYYVAANAAGYRGEIYDDVQNRADATLVEVNEPATTDSIDFGLAATSAIQGVVTNEMDNTPIPGAYILAYGSSITARDHRILLRARSDENGRYILQLRPGSYIVYASAEGFNSEFYDDKPDRSSADPVTVAEGAHTPGIDFELIPRSTISGAVTDSTTGSPIAGAIIEAHREWLANDLRTANDVVSDVGFRARSDSLGHYLIENVPTGKYILLARAEGYLHEFYQEQDHKANATLVEVGENTGVQDIDFTLETGGGISGLVAAESDSMPIGRALVQIYHTNTGRYLTTYSDDHGAYKIGGLSPGEYLVYVVARGYFPEFYDNVRHRDNATPVEVVAAAVTENIDFYLAEYVDGGGTISGRVYSDLDESPLHGAVVIAVAPNRRWPHITFTGMDGSYRLTNLPEGRYYVFAWAPRFIGEFFDNAKRFRDAEPVAVAPNQVAVASFGLAPVTRDGIYSITGRIRRRSSTEPVSGALVQARLNGNIEVNAVTNSDGSYVISGLPAGEYQVEASGAGFSDGFYGGTNESNAAIVSVGNGEDALEVNLEMEIDNITSVQNGVPGVPGSFALSQNYPNPFNPETTIKYQLAESADVTLKVYNLLGQEVVSLVNDVQVAGNYTVSWDGKNSFGRPVASGIYIFRLEAGDKFHLSKRMMLLK